MKIFDSLVLENYSPTITSESTEEAFLYSKNDGYIYYFSGTTETEIGKNNKPHNLTVGSNFFGIESPPTNGVLIEGKLNIEQNSTSHSTVNIKTLSLHHKNFTNTANANPDDYCFLSFICNGSSRNCNLVYAKNHKGRIYKIKRLPSDYNLLIKAKTGETIDGEETLTISNVSTIVISSDGDNWQILESHNL